MYGTCIPCPNNKYTVNEASESVNNCTFFKCQPGYKSNAAGTNCDICPKGTYQPEENQVTCESCPNDQSTRTTGSTAKAKCEDYCPNGKEKDNTGDCDECLIGFYKNNTEDVFMNCTACQANYVTANPVSGGINLCVIRNCLAGTKRNSDDTDCINCAKGTFQNLPYQPACYDCPTLEWTRQEKSTASSSCESYCPSGKEKQSDGSCDDCDIGYFKDNNVDKFSECTLCGNGKITSAKAAVAETECTIANCSAGYKTNNVTNTCDKCVKGKYQPDKWTTSCLECPEFKTTPEQGATSLSDCVLECPPGLQDVGGTCTKCPIGYYKSQTAAATCEKCLDNFITENNGSTAAADCFIPECGPGYYLDRTAVPLACNWCPYNKYQDEKWQESCKDCEDGKVTLDTISDSVSDCVLDCASGSAYDNVTKTCILCERGYFRVREDRTHKTCQKCPGGYITESIGATSVTLCNILGCTELGTYSDSTTVTCRDCPVGKYTDQQFMTECTQCQSGYTTQFTKSNTSADCKRDCPAGSELRGSSCIACTLGTYRNKSESWTCVACSNGYSTSVPSAASADLCTASPCLAGYKFVPGSGGNCVNCPKDTYQPNSGQFSCIDCPNGGYTLSGASTSVSQCKSHCATGDHNCSTNAVCADADTASGYMCTCNTDYTGTGLSCSHKCDSGYCVQGTCIRVPLSCTCPDLYSGQRCEVRGDPSKKAIDNEKIIIGAVVGGVAFLMIVLIIVVCCCVHAQRTQPIEKVQVIRAYPQGQSMRSSKLALQAGPPPSVHESYIYDNRSFIGDAQNPEVTMDLDQYSDPAFYAA